jgi:dTMP kinase
MPARGKLIVLEGIDGSGKRTQVEMLARAFAERGIPCKQISFPRYDSFFGKMVARFLNGEFGQLDAVDPHFSALLYAGDRLEAKREIEADLSSGLAVLCDRYIGSNLAHQSAMVPRRKRKEFLRWLTQLEYKIYSLPLEDLVVYLRVPAVEAQRLVDEKGRRKYTKLRRDILEANLAHWKTASEVYEGLSKRPNWAIVECAGKRGGLSARTSVRTSLLRSLRAPEEIHSDVLAVIGKRLFQAAGAIGQVG